MVTSDHARRVRWCARLVGGALSIVPCASSPDFAYAQGILDFLFGGRQEHEVAPPPSPHPPPVERPGRIAPAALGQERINEGGGSTRHGVAFCVRLCDGHHFPLEQMVKRTASETCRAICPYSRTKVFFGTEIGTAIAGDGQHYASLDTAFLYRRQLVTNCTCNGKNAFGLAPLDVKNDPTLQTGDLISTANGLTMYTGSSAQGPTFTPVDPATLPPNIGAAH